MAFVFFRYRCPVPRTRQRPVSCVEAERFLIPLPLLFNFYLPFSAQPGPARLGGQSQIKRSPQRNLLSNLDGSSTALPATPAFSHLRSESTSAFVLITQWGMEGCLCLGEVYFFSLSSDREREAPYLFYQACCFMA